MVTLCNGSSSLPRPFSLSGDPIRNSPAGTTTISGQAGQSRNTRPAPEASAGSDRLWAASPFDVRNNSEIRVITVRTAALHGDPAHTIVAAVAQAMARAAAIAG